MMMEVMPQPAAKRRSNRLPRALRENTYKGDIIGENSKNLLYLFILIFEYTVSEKLKCSTPRSTV